MVTAPQLPQEHCAAVRYPLKRDTLWTQQYLHNSVTAALGDVRRVMTTVSARPLAGPVAPGEYGYNHEKAKLQSSISHLKEVLGSTKKSSQEWSQLNEIIKKLRRASHYSIHIDEVTDALTSLSAFERRAFGDVSPT